MSQIEDELLYGKRARGVSSVMVAEGVPPYPDHNKLPGLQGGLATGTGQRYHLTAAQWTGLTGVVAGRVVYASAAGVLASDAGFTYDAATDALQVNGSVSVGTGASADNDLLLKLWSDRAWQFEVDGDGAATRLVLRTLYDLKVFAIQSLDSTDAFAFTASDTDASCVFSATGPVRAGAGTVGAVAFGAGGDVHTGIYFPADHALGVVLGGAEKWRYIVGALQPITANQEDLGGTANELKDGYFGGSVYFGTSQSARIYWDGTDLVIG